LLENENSELKDKIKQLLEHNKTLQTKVKDIHHVNNVAGVLINKNLLHKELLSKDLINQDKATAVLNRNYNMKFSSFGDVLNDQYSVSKRAQKVAKFAFRWLNTVRINKQFKLNVTNTMTNSMRTTVKNY